MAHLILKSQFDLTPKGKIVDKAEIGEEGYAENVQYDLILQSVEGGVIALWMGEDDTEISLEEYLQKTK